MLAAGVFAVSAQPVPVPWTDAQAVQPAALAARLAESHAAKPKVFYVGPAFLYRSKHVPGAVFVGPVNKPEGLQALREAVGKLPRNEEVIVYCGCCPLNDCPNIRPAFRLLSEMGFKRAKVLLTPTNFQRDWIEKGYPVETGMR